jgi:hypothetical protein
MMKERLLQRVDELIEMGNAVLATRYQGASHMEYVNGGMIKEFRASGLSFIEKIYGEKHSHFQEFVGLTDGYGPENVELGLGILRAIRGEIAGDWLFTVKGLVTAEVFTDYIEMAEYLLQEQYKDPAAVIAGSTLEEHLRQLCRKNGMPVTQPKDGKDVPLKADRLNNDLARANVYTNLDQKNVTAWLDLRNKAAHGQYTEYNAEQVKGMIAGVTESMARVSV